MRTALKITFACAIVAASLALLAWLIWVRHPFIDALTWVWLRDTATAVVLLALGGVGAWKLQDRWVRRRMPAEKDFEIPRNVYRQLSVVIGDVAELLTGPLLPRVRPLR